MFPVHTKLTCRGRPLPQLSLANFFRVVSADSESVAILQWLFGLDGIQCRQRLYEKPSTKEIRDACQSVHSSITLKYWCEREKGGAVSPS